MTLQDKKRKLRKLKSLLNTAWRISNDLVGEESTHSSNQNSLYAARAEIELIKTRISFVKYPKEEKQ